MLWRRMLMAALLGATGCASAPEATGGANGWRPLFNGKDLAGWTRVNGLAPFAVEDGAIVGTSVADGPNSFLATQETFGDFVLELESRADAPANSGVQFRAILAPQFRFSGLTGYQLEIDLSDRNWTGGIYIEGENRFVAPPLDNPACKAAYVPGSWNRLRIEAHKETLRTFVNGAPCANLVDATYARGFVALQVHAPPASPAGTRVAWRNLRIKTTGLDAEWSRITAKEDSYLVNALTDRERREGWRLLFDGVSESGWRTAEGAQGVAVADRALILTAGQSAQINAPVDNFELIFDARLSAGSEGAIHYGHEIASAFQLFDDPLPAVANDAQKAQMLGALKGRIAPQNLSEPRRTKRYNGPGTWTRGRIVVRNGHVEHWLNSVKVIDYDLPAPASRAAETAGEIRVTVETGQIAFRSLKVRPIN